MTTELFQLPFPSSGRSHEEFKEMGGRRCMVACHYSADGSDAVNLLFDGVEAYKATFEEACTGEMIRVAYDRVVDLGATPWLAEVAVELSQHGPVHSGLQHLMIYFDDGPATSSSAVPLRPEKSASLLRAQGSNPLATHLLNEQATAGLSGRAGAD